MLVLDGVYVERPDGTLRFRRVAAPTSAELNALTATLAHRIGRFLERRGLIERDAENAWLADDADGEAAPLEQLRAASITYRVAFGPRRGRKAFTLPPVAEEAPDDKALGKVNGFSLRKRSTRTVLTLSDQAGAFLAFPVSFGRAAWRR